MTCQGAPSASFRRPTGSSPPSSPANRPCSTVSRRAPFLARCFGADPLLGGGRRLVRGSLFEDGAGCGVAVELALVGVVEDGLGLGGGVVGTGRLLLGKQLARTR